MVAVVLVAGGLNGYGAALAAFDKHEHGVHGLHDHGSHDHADHHDDAAMSSDVADATQGSEDPASDCGLCAHVHVHSCCAYAVPAADVMLKLSHPHLTVPVATSHIPAGQLATLLFRPPRADA